MERVSGAVGGDKKKDVGGRKGADRQEAVPDPEALKAGLPTVERALKEADEANETASDKVKALAKKSGFLATVVRKAARANMGEPETFEEEKRKAEQLSLAFETLEKE